MARTLFLSVIVSMSIFSTASAQEPDQEYACQSGSETCASSAQEQRNSSPQIEFKNSFTIDGRYIYQTAEYTNLRPTDEFTDLKGNSLRSTGIWSFRAQAEQLSFNSQLRFSGLQKDGEHSSFLSVDEAYFEMNIGDVGFVHLGRKHQNQGKAIGVSILDFFNYSTDFDRTLNLDRRKRDIKGVDSFGAEFFAGDNYSISFVYAPHTGRFNTRNEDRFQISLDYTLLDQNLDIFAAAYYEETQTVGLGFSKTIGDAWTVYGEATARKGRHRIVPKISNPALGTFTNGAQDNKWVGSALIGFGFTTPSGLSINGEYLFNGDGYNKSEWDELTQLIDINNANLGSLRGLAFKNLATLGRAFRSRTNRQHYLFARIAHPTLFQLSDTSGEITIFHNLEDNSGNISGRIEYELNNSTILGLSLSTYYGGPNSEFGLIGEKFTAGLYVTKNF